MKTTLHKTLAVTAACGALTFTSCQTHTQRGAVAGGLSGAAIGAVAADDGRRGEGALIGGAIGAAAGAAIGSGKDRRYGNHRHNYR